MTNRDERTKRDESSQLVRSIQGRTGREIYRSRPFVPDPARIGGSLDYARLAELNRPTDEEALRREVLLMFSRGLTAGDIGIALRLDPTAVRALLVEAGNA